MKTLLHSEKTMNLLRWTKTFIKIYVLITFAVLANSALNILTIAKMRNLLVLPGFWFATSSLLLLIAWSGLTPSITRRISIKKFRVLSAVLVIIVLLELYAAAQPVTDIAVQVSPTVRLVHKAYPPYLEIWVRACAIFGFAAFTLSGINLILKRQTAERQKAQNSNSSKQ